MRITIRNKDLRLTVALSLYIEEKLIAHVRRMLGAIDGVDFPTLDLELGRSTRHHHKGEVFYGSASLVFGKHVVRAESTAEDIRSACDGLREELLREIQNFKGKTTAVERREARRLKKNVRFAKAAHLNQKGRVRDESV